MWIIYICTNTVNGKRYIGQTKFTAKRRWTKHLNAANNIKSNAYKTYFCNAIRKYNKTDWLIEVIEDNIETINAANAAEEWWVGHFCSNDRRFGYNSTNGGKNCEISQETKDKISKKHKGKITSQDTRDKLSISIKELHKNEEYRKNYEDGRKHIKKRTDEQKIKMSNAALRHKRSGKNKFIGVKKARNGTFEARISFHSKCIYIGSSKCEETAAKMRDKKAIELLGDKAILNFPDDYKSIPK